jgi:hypothetical protein
MAEMVGDVFEEVEAEAVPAEAIAEETTLEAKLLALSFGEERLGSVRFGEGNGSEIGEEVVKG